MIKKNLCPLLCILWLISPFCVLGSLGLKTAEVATDTSRKFLGSTALFLKVVLTGAETYNWALELGASGSHGSELYASGMAGLHAGGTLQAIGIGGLQLAAGLAMTQIWPGVAFLMAELVLSGVIEEEKDRIGKSAVRLSALSSFSQQMGDQKSPLLETIRKTNRGRVKYRCKGIQAIKQAKQKSFVDTQFCIINNAMPMDYLCEYLAHLPEKNIGRIQEIAHIIKDPMVNAYRRILKYRFLDKYYTAINDEFEGLVKFRSLVNIEDRLNASEFWTPDSVTNLGDILKEMKDGKLMDAINECHKNGCDEHSEHEKKFFLDTNAKTSYKNYCEYYFRKKEIHLGFFQKNLSKDKQDKFQRFMNRASDRFENLIETFQGIDSKEHAEGFLNSLTTVSDAAEKWRQIQNGSDSEKQKWKDDPKNKPLLDVFEHLKEEGKNVDADDSGEKL